MRKIIKLQPKFHYRIWGGERIKNYYPNLNEEKIGEAWITSCIKGSENSIEGSKLNLNEFWKQNPEFFGIDTSITEFPILVKIIDAKDDLSIQVHPDDLKAQQLENYQYGKSECWYILESSNKSAIVYGLNTKNINDIKTMIANDEWDKLLSTTKVNEGEIYNIPAGLTHAIKADNFILEVQQPCDITYRLYDYGRLEADGNQRELHLNKGIQAIKPELSNEKTIPKQENFKEATLTNLLTTDMFEINKVNVKGSIKFSECDEKFNSWANIFINKGFVKINDENFSKGDSIIVNTSNEDFDFVGECELFIMR